MSQAKLIGLLCQAEVQMNLAFEQMSGGPKINLQSFRAIHQAIRDALNEADPVVAS